ncbi:hypothetical protein KC19_VG080200 [Ceratodon purpureus]|uniref:Uncharacterized protein n=1 Tax=Ceratodon purpureus TaxID=3225 RepID=A0A8T0HN65_CERPU|nr:hypothetical protein KC19_VG080200 [Ceratodon purpureus]
MNRKSASHNTQLRALQLALSVRNLALDLTALSLARRRSLFTLATGHGKVYWNPLPDLLRLPFNMPIPAATKTCPEVTLPVFNSSSTLSTVFQTEISSVRV